MNLDYTTGFEPRTEVVELWKALPTPGPELEARVAELKQVPGVEVFDEVWTSRVEKTEVLYKLFWDFFGLVDWRLGDGGKVNPFISLGIENVFQHADPDHFERKVSRNIRTPPPYARACVAVQLQLGRFFDAYVMDDGKGFVHPETGDCIMAEALQTGVGFGKHSTFKKGLKECLRNPDESILISVGSWIRKPGPYTGFSPVEPAPPAYQGIKGTLICGRFYHPKVQDEMRGTC